MEAKDKIVTCSRAKISETYSRKYTVEYSKEQGTQTGPDIVDSTNEKMEGKKDSKNGKMKLAFVKSQNLIKGADGVFNHTTFNPLFVNVLIGSSLTIEGKFSLVFNGETLMTYSVTTIN